MKEAQETQGKKRIAGWNVALWASLAVAYSYLLPILFFLSFGRLVSDPSFPEFGYWHLLSISLLVAAVVHYFWFQRVAPALGNIGGRSGSLGLLGMGYWGWPIGRPSSPSRTIARQVYPR